MTMDARKSLKVYKTLGDEDGITSLNPMQLEALKAVALKVHACRTLGVPLPTAIVEASNILIHELTIDEKEQ